ncbi:MAG: TGS domain-containing protein, partial [Carnobacterium sp.]
PKSNMYQSIHTTVIGPNGRPVEVQIRTEEMHQVAEYGVAAHWAYKEGITKRMESTDVGEKISWFRDILELQSESNDASDFMESVKGDILKDKVYVFTPKGDVSELPSGAGPLDFAYHIHTEIGNKTIGAKVNGKIVPLNYKLKTGDIIEILTSPNSSGPSRDWISVVSTSKAKNKIKRFFKLQDREENIIKGRESLEKQLQEMQFLPKDFLTKQNIKVLSDRFNFTAEEDLYASIGFGEVTALAVANRLTEKERRVRENEKKALEIDTIEVKSKKETDKIKVRHEGGIVIQGVDNLLVRISRCCSPVPGDPIVGYITKGRGISIHRADCPNVKAAKDAENRLIDVEWEDTSSQGQEYDADLQIEGYNRSGLLNEVLQVVNGMTRNLNNVSGKVDNNRMATITLTVGIPNLNHLERIIDKIKMIPDVYNVHRISS